MISSELKAQIKKLELVTRKKMVSSHYGSHKTISRGSGFEFESIREYVPGDDFRRIDWSATARGQKLLVRQYYEDRGRTVMLVVDGSASTFFGVQRSRYDMIKEAAAVIAYAAVYRQDAVGLIIFSDEIKLYIPPSRSRVAFDRMIETLFLFQPAGKSNFNKVFSELPKKLKKNCMVFLISDFIVDSWNAPLHVLSHCNDVVALSCLESVEKEPAPWGIIECYDPETHKQHLLDFRFGSVKKMSALLHARNAEIASVFKGAGIDFLQLECTQNYQYVDKIINFFKSRISQIYS